MQYNFTMDTTVLIVIIVCVALLLAVGLALLLRGRINLSASTPDYSLGVDASRPAKNPPGIARISNSTSRDGGATAEGESAEIHKTNVKGDLTARSIVNNPDGGGTPK